VASERHREREEDRGELGPLPGGHHGLSREQIADSQRERLLAAIAAEVAEVGYRDVKIRAFTSRAGVSTRDFYELFETKEACFLAAFDAVREHLEKVVTAAASGPPDWPHQVSAALRAALDFFAAEPDLARLCLVDPVSATPTTAVHFRGVVLACAPALARGRELLEDPDALPPSTEDSLLGGAVSLAAGNVVTGRTEELPALLPDLVEFLLTPYLGSQRAAALGGETATG